MKTEKIKEKYLHYGLEKEDIFKHQHYLIICRSGIEKIQAIEGIESRAVLKLTGFYELGVFGEDESEDFKKSNNQINK